MGQASRRGSFEERKEQAVIRNRSRLVESMEKAEKADALLPKEERDARINARLSMLSFMTMIKRSGMTMKEGKRRIKRFQKKHKKTVDK